VSLYLLIEVFTVFSQIQEDVRLCYHIVKFRDDVTVSVTLKIKSIKDKFIKECLAIQGRDAY